MSAALVSLVGAPGSGKTTVAHWLAGAMDAALVLEDYAGNPFLAESYAGLTELRLAGQAWFLLSRVNQLAKLHWSAGRVAVADYAFLQDRIYGEIWLSGDRLEAYRWLAAEMAELVQPPSVLIHLDGPVELLTERIAGRRRDYEKHFTLDFLRRLGADFSVALADAPCPVIAVDIARRDMLLPEHQQWLLAELRRVMSAG